MTEDELIDLDEELISLEELNTIKQMKEVVSVESYGKFAGNNAYEWYAVILADGISVDVCVGE